MKKRRNSKKPGRYRNSFRGNRGSLKRHSDFLEKRRTSKSKYALRRRSRMLL